VKLMAEISHYGGVATKGKGVAPIIDVVNATNRGAAIGSTNLTGTNVAGLYRVSYYFYVTTEDAGAVSAEMELFWNDEGAARNASSGLIDLSGGSGSPTMQSGSEFIYTSGNYITYSTTVDTIGTAKYALRIAAERLN